MEEQKSTQHIGKTEGKLLNLALLALGITTLGVVATGLVMSLLLNPSRLTSQDEIVEASPTLPVEDLDRVENGLDVATGFIAAGDYQLVKTTCTACHSSKLVLQNRATREGWIDMIRWMQETQKLWDLGPNEDKIVSYLATYYGPEKKGRRAPLEIKDWYVIE